MCALLSSVADRALATLREPGAGSRRAPALLADVTAGSSFVRLLDAVVDDEQALAEIGGRSYRHALGFDKLILLSMLPYGQLRLHVWWPGDEHGREHPHNHRFASHSVVIAGSLRNHAYQESASGPVYEQYRERSAVADAHWTFEPAGTRRLAPVLVTDMPAGTSYSMSAELVHRTEASAGLTATVFLETRCVRDWSNVYVGPGERVPVGQQRPRFTAAQVRGRLVRLRDGLASASG